jgi:hypothetical protein
MELPLSSSLFSERSNLYSRNPELSEKALKFLREDSMVIVEAAE